MNMQDNMYRPQEYTIADRASVDERGWFLVRTYAHLFAAIVAFIGIETIIQVTPIGETLLRMIFGAGNAGWLVVIVAFMAATHFANKWAHSNTSIGVQYAGLSLYVLAQAVIMAPIIFIASVNYPGVIQQAALATLFIFVGLTAVVFVTRKNFSFMGPFLGVMGFAAIGLIFCSIIFGFNLGTVFTVVMIVLASGYILYSTSNVLHEYNTHQYVAASLALFAAVALLFFYLLRLFMSRR